MMYQVREEFTISSIKNNKYTEHIIEPYFGDSSKNMWYSQQVLEDFWLSETSKSIGQQSQKKQSKPSCLFK